MSIRATYWMSCRIASRRPRGHSDARAVEQALIKTHGLGRNGGTLLNRINSISPLSPTYKDQLASGYELLQSIWY